MNPSYSGTKTLTSITESYYYGKSSDSYYSPRQSMIQHKKSKNRNYESSNQNVRQLEDKKYDLESKVESLKHRISKLKKEKLKKEKLKKMKKKTASKKISAPPQINQTTEMHYLIKSYVNVMQQITSLDAECEVLEVQIHNEKDRREIMLDEFDAIDNTFRFIDYCPKIELNQFQSFKEIQIDDPFVYRRRVELLRSLQKEINDIDCQRKSTQTQSQAALEFARSSFAEVKLKSVDSSSIKLEIESLEHTLKNLSIELMKRENEKENLRQKLLKYELENKNEISNLQQRSKMFQDTYDKELNYLDSTIYKTSCQIDKRAKEFDVISQDIERLDLNSANVYEFPSNHTNGELINEYNFANEEEEEEINFHFEDDKHKNNNNETIFDFSDNTQNAFQSDENYSIIKSYQQQKEQLLIEIEKFKKELEETKSKAKERKEKLKSEIYELYSLYNQKKKELKIEMGGNDENSSSGLSSAFADLAVNIDYSINDLRQIQQSP